LTRSWGKTTVTLEPVGVAGLITAWNECGVHLLRARLGIAAGYTVVH
jgi:aldehyde dehydrogenase (NAD+)